jgi:transposase
VIPSIAKRKPLIPYDPVLYRQRNLIERMFSRLTDFRRIATRYDKLARNFLAGISCRYSDPVDLIESGP